MVRYSVITRIVHGIATRMSDVCARRPLGAALAAIAIAATSAGLGAVIAASARAAVPATPSRVFAPYWESYSGDGPLSVFQQSGATYMTAAFLNTASRGSCTVYWNGNTSTPVSYSQWGSDFAAIQADGGNVIPSFGGYAADTSGTDIADSCTSVSKIASVYERVITTYNFNRIDLDVEGEDQGDSLSNTAGITRRNQAIAMVENWAASTGRSVQFSYTLPTNPTGLDSNALGVIQNAVAEGATITTVNAMTFDYYIGTTQDMVADTETAGAAIESQLTSLYPADSPSQLWGMLGVTEMPGIDDFGAQETFTQADATEVLSWAESQGIGELSFWALERDNGGCQGTGGSDTCSGIVQPAWYFSNAFEPFTNSTTAGQIYEADAAALGGSAYVSGCHDCVDGSKVSGIGGAGLGTVTFTGVFVPSAGTYQMIVNYISVGKARSATIAVNGNAQTVSFPETSASSYSVLGTTTVTVSLNAGSSNTIVVSGAGTHSAPDLSLVLI